jgi:hypothetical protein
MMITYDPDLLIADMKAAEGVGGYLTQVLLQSGYLATIRQQGVTGMFEADITHLPTSGIVTEPEAFTPEEVIQKLREWEALPVEEPSE